jgi:hypothetical protein
MIKTKLFWIPRSLSIILILFLTLLSLDVFEMQGTMLEKIGGFLIHMVPAFVAFILLALSWKYPLPAGLVFIFSGIIFAMRFPMALNFMIIPSFVVLIGILYVAIYWGSRKKQQADR